MYHDKTVFLVIIIQTDTDRSYDERIFFDILLFKGYFLQYFLTAESNTLLWKSKFICQHLGVTVDFSASTNDKCSTDSLSAI